MLVNIKASRVSNLIHAGTRQPGRTPLPWRATFALALFLSPAGLLAQPPSWTIELESPPRWAPSGAFSPSGELVLVGVKERALFVYDVETGRLLKRVTRLSGADFDLGRSRLEPSVIQAFGERGMVLENKDGMMLFLDADLRVVDVVDLVGATTADGRALRAVFNWSVSPEAGFTLYGDLQSPAGKWSTAIARVPLEGGVVEVIQEVDPGDRARQFFLFGNQLVVNGLGGDAHWILMRNPPELHSYFPSADAVSAHRMTTVGGRFGERPDLPIAHGPESAVSLFGALERSAMPLSLHRGSRGELLILTRLPFESTGEMTEWVVTRLDEGLNELFSVRLPHVTAPHVQLVAGSRYHAAIQKSKVVEPGNQAILSVDLFSADLIESSGSPLQVSYGTPYLSD